MRWYAFGEAVIGEVMAPSPARALEVARAELGHLVQYVRTTNPSSLRELAAPRGPVVVTIYPMRRW
jgi:hypothetical protein